MDSKEKVGCEKENDESELNEELRRQLLASLVREMAAAHSRFEALGIAVVPAPDRCPDPRTVAFVIMGQPLYITVNEHDVLVLSFPATATPYHTACSLAFATRDDVGDLASLAVAAYFIVRDTEVIEAKRVLSQRLQQLDAYLGGLHHSESRMVAASRTVWPFDVLKLDDAVKRLLNRQKGLPEPKISPIIGVN